ncbi:fatty acid cis/trans isomerase [Aestuariirhabdus sp. Z084]|uniref:fatty acid cis/trans isomerase n=1 Tax=Aestuariirhabdus haliotis TaxID=2918751 RepID=UPI00201B435F|nr:fatty acid cis/trans isomerase [Aestuariirhabdus haliotis]MCL6416237.1 fatty acid cis/trans isomerase [Aestuariirhabdus haliotis]MCL6420303.1 fatty acid cis/trans isomerase [Aestuariirhabdus haliotis]
MKVNRGIVFGLIVVISGCAGFGAMTLEQRYGVSEPRERTLVELPPDQIDYWSEVKPVLEQRCVVCHACYDAPCQLKLTSTEGIDRGASSSKVYNSLRLKAAPMSRLNEDAQSTAEWRQKGFFPVLNEYENSPQANRDASVMYRILQLKQQHPLPQQKLLPETFDLSLDRKQSCTTAGQFSRFADDHPLWGMPYALPALPAHEQNILLRWLEQGAMHTPRAALDEKLIARVQHWEAFLNADSRKAQLVSRYIYEHLFLAHLYFPELNNRVFFQLVRSKTPPGQPVDRIATRRPYGDPGVQRVYYRLVEHTETVVAKTHMPYRLDQSRMARWQSLFFDEPYSVNTLPGYEDAEASNPFLTFKDLPVRARYKFMLDEARFTINGFIKGPVCRGQVALNVINDHFWVFFVDPDVPDYETAVTMLANRSQRMDMPAASNNIYSPMTHWLRYSRQQKALLSEKDLFLSQQMNGRSLGLDLIWNGNGGNDNAALTVYRHNDSATVEKGLLGQEPKTAWVIGYELLERIHYLLVTGYDVYGNTGHQLLTRLYMDFLRMEGEANFLMLLPKEARNRERNYWYRGAEDEVIKYMTLPNFEQDWNPDIDYQTDNQKSELYALLSERLSAVLPQRHRLESIEDAAIRNALQPLSHLQGGPVTLLPQTLYLKITSQAEPQFLTLVRNNAHLNITSMFNEMGKRKPDEDTLDVIPGFIGSYPNAFYQVDRTQLNDFVQQLSSMQSEQDYELLLDRYGVRRTEANFWSLTDPYQRAYRELYPVEGGVIDYSRLENR